MEKVYIHHIPDRLVKTVFPKDATPFRFLPDGVLRKKNRFIIFEYENSSRGLLSHTTKYHHYCYTNSDIKLTVVFIESLNHQLKWKTDTLLAKHIASIALPNVKFLFLKCDGTLSNIKAIVKKYS
jgi:hypothetical protein